MRNRHEIHLDKFGRTNLIFLNRAHETVLYERKLDGSIGPRYKTTTFLQIED